MNMGDLVRVSSTTVSINWKPEQGYLGLIASPVRLGADAQYVNVQSVKTGVALWVRAYRLTPCDKTEGAK
tara:strand:- start:563 stop:772 length:210 start_codon:yes stop_codon:yes gene_type:complete